MPRLAVGALACSALTGWANAQVFSGLSKVKHWDGYSLHWMADEANSVLHVGIEAPLAGSSTRSDRGWVGFGIAEPSAGSMPGADMLILRKQGGQWIAEDRYALGFITPELDEQQDWVLESATEVDGTLRARLRRAFDTNDGQDRPFISGTKLVIWARGSSQTAFYQHVGGNRRVENAVFRENKVVQMDWSEREPDTDMVLLSMGGYTLPKKRTTYACKSHRPPKLFNGQDAWLTRFDFVNRNPKFNHHFIVHSCDHDAQTPNGEPGIWQEFDGHPKECESPQGNFAKGCRTAVYIWAAGAANWTLPQDAGYLVSDTSPHGIKAFVVEMHFDNPDGEEGITDNSSVNIYFTRRPRKHDVGLLTVGDPLVAADPLPPKAQDVHVQFSCSGACTERFDHPITIIGTALHMHQYGRRMFSVLHHRNGPTEYLNRAEFYSFDNQQTNAVHAILNPGDTLNTHCIFTNPTDRPVNFNLGSDDEMCMEFVLYYPVLTRKKDGIPVNFCGYITRFWEYPFVNGTICGVDLLDKTETDFSRCNPSPGEVDSPQCYASTWGTPGPAGARPPMCTRPIDPGFQCNRVRHVVNVDADGTEKFRWVDAADGVGAPLEPLVTGESPAGCVAASFFSLAAAAAVATV